MAKTSPQSHPTLTRDRILAVKPPVSPPIHVPELGGSVHLRVMDGLQRERYERAHAAEGRTDLRATLLALTLSDPSGSLLFAEKDVPALNALPAPALIRLYNEAMRLNAVTDEQIEELAGN